MLIGRTILLPSLSGCSQQALVETARLGGKIVAWTIRREILTERNRTDRRLRSFSCSLRRPPQTGLHGQGESALEPWCRSRQVSRLPLVIDWMAPMTSALRE
jgi:hypothetical protein